VGGSVVAEVVKGGEHLLPTQILACHNYAIHIPEKDPSRKTLGKTHLTLS
jgi:hypothetical protein